MGLELSIDGKAVLRRLPTTSSMRAAGLLLFAGGCAALGLAELIHASPLPNLHAFGENAAVAAIASGASLLFLGLFCLFRPGTLLPATALAGHWGIAGLLAGWAALSDPAGAIAWVPAAETAIFAFAAATLPRARRSGGSATALRILRFAFGSMLLFFGSVHILYREAIAGLIPEWIPLHGEWPLLTGSIMLVAGAACLAGKGVGPLSALVAVMWLSWIPIVHLGRLAASPHSLFEWTFALTAVTLAGVALIVSSTYDDRL